MEDLEQELYVDSLGGSGVLKTPTRLNDDAGKTQDGVLSVASGEAVVPEDHVISEHDLKQPKKNLFPMLVQAVNISKYDYSE